VFLTAHEIKLRLAVLMGIESCPLHFVVNSEILDFEMLRTNGNPFTRAANGAFFFFSNNLTLLL
jgi:hypothetical protein